MLYKRYCGWNYDVKSILLLGDLIQLWISQSEISLKIHLYSLSEYLFLVQTKLEDKVCNEAVFLQIPTQIVDYAGQVFILLNKNENGMKKIHATYLQNFFVSLKRALFFPFYGDHQHLLRNVSSSYSLKNLLIILIIVVD